MDQVYDNQYCASVREMKAQGMEVFLVNASELRSRLKTAQKSPRTMDETLQKRLKAMCKADLSLTQCSVDRLIERDKVEAPGQTRVNRGKVDQSIG